MPRFLLPLTDALDLVRLVDFLLAHFHVGFNAKQTNLYVLLRRGEIGLLADGLLHQGNDHHAQPIGMQRTIQCQFHDELWIAPIVAAMTATSSGT